MDDARDRMIDGTIRLLATRGLQGSSFSEVLKLTDAPRGSIYHHFPDGKEQMVGEAIQRASDQALAHLGADEATPLDVADRFIQMWRDLLVHTGQHAGCSVVAVTVAADTPGLVDRAGAIFRSWESHLARRFEAGGVAPSHAADLAAVLVAGCEGAVVMSRAERSLEPFDRTARVLRSLVLGAEASGSARPDQRPRAEGSG